VRLIDGKPAALLQFNSPLDACEFAGLAVPDRLG
jgi:hypothetical protein